jgi:geranylgeranyl pyrophosphate synthase
MVGGQHVDLETAGHASIDPETLEYIQSRKTGALFVISARLGPLLLGTDPRRLDELEQYARSLGLAYQIVDDILDTEGDPGATGKDAGRDAASNKKTFVTVHGVDQARDAAARLARAAEQSLADWSEDAGLLREIARYCVDRTA